MKNIFLVASEWPIIVVFTLIGACLLIVLSFLLVAFLKNKDVVYIMNKIPSTLSLTIDTKNNIVYVFNKKKLLGVKDYSLEDYLKNFKGNSRQKVEEMINMVKLNMAEELPNTIEVNCIHSNKNKKVYFSVMNITSINLDCGIIHITQYFYNNIPALYGIDLKRENKYRSMFNVPKNVVKNRIVNAGTKGAALLVHYEIASSYKYADISVLIYYALINILSKFINQNRALIRDRENDLVILDFKTYKRHKTYALANKIKKEFDKVIEMNGAANRIKFSIAITENKFYPRDMQKIFKALHQTSAEATSKNKDFMFYENQDREEYFYDQSYKTEVVSIVENHSLKYQFMPIVGLKKFDAIGYFSKIIPISTVFTEINDVKNHAYQSSYARELFSEISKHLLSKFVNEAGAAKDSVYLFYNLKHNEVGYANSLLGFILASKKCNLVLSFNETDLLKHLDKNIDFIEPFRKLASKGYRLSLEVTLKTLELPDELYSLFDYFIFDIRFFDENFDDISHSSLTLKRSIEKILKYKKRVIVTSVNSWNEMELRIQENLKYLAGDVISPYNDMILPLNKKVIDKIKKIKKRG